MANTVVGGVVVSNTFKVGKAFYPTLKKAYHAALKNTPMLKASLGWLEKKLGCVEQVVTKKIGAETRTTKETKTLEKEFLQNEKLWQKGEEYTFHGQTNKVYKRDDLIDLKKMDIDSGLTNAQLMKRGRAPIGPDNQPVNLHHMLQTQEGPLAEITTTLHKKGHDILHIWPNGSNGGITRPEIRPQINRQEFNQWRSEYWKNRAIELEK